MASTTVKLANVCIMFLSVGQMMLASTGGHDGADEELLRLQDLEEEVLIEELGLLNDGMGAGATVCTPSCRRCLGSCVAPCIGRPARFVACFLNCALGTRDCFDKK
jgi:hypothetical protein